MDIEGLDYPRASNKTLRGGETMKIYVIKVTAYIPYPIKREYTEKASNFSVAISRAVKKYRQDPRISRKRIDTITVSAGAAKFNL